KSAVRIAVGTAMCQLLVSISIISNEILRIDMELTGVYFFLAPEIRCANVRLTTGRYVLRMLLISTYSAYKQLGSHAFDGAARHQRHPTSKRCGGAEVIAGVRYSVIDAFRQPRCKLAAWFLTKQYRPDRPA